MISTHVLDTSIGRPAANVRVTLARQESAGAWREVASAVTDANGRIAGFLANEPALSNGSYRLAFDVGSYFGSRHVEAFFTVVTVEFLVRDGGAHHHVPLLVSPYGYSTYRGS
jgi:5-hydroxyisourate hydrolase